MRLIAVVLDMIETCEHKDALSYFPVCTNTKTTLFRGQRLMVRPVCIIMEAKHGSNWDMMTNKQYLCWVILDLKQSSMLSIRLGVQIGWLAVLA